MRARISITLFLFLLSLNAIAGVFGEFSFVGETLPLKGIWIDQNVIAINEHNSSQFQYILEGEGVRAELSNVGYFDDEDSEFYKKFDYVARSRFSKFFIDLSRVKIEKLIQGPISILKKDLYSGLLVEKFAVSLTGLLDKMFAYKGESLGISFDGDTTQFRIWSPTAKRVKLHLYKSPNRRSEIAGSPFELSMNSENVWFIEKNSVHGLYYLYEIESFKRRAGGVTTELLTDLYSTNLSLNSEFSQVIDVANASMPAGWTGHKLKKNYEIRDASDISIYELHVRDFSYFDFTQPPEHRGKFLAFTNQNTNGVRHLKELAESGVSHVHLLPVNDQSSVNEDESERSDLSQADFDYLHDALESGEMQQGIASRIRKSDGFNWGYDPLHYQALEGSYSTDPNSDARIIEFRKLVMSLHGMGLGVIADTVFNHYSELLNLDSYVPDYYYSLNGCGDITMESCCPDLATENEMVMKLIVDSAINLVKWYRLDGIRFDLMGFITKDVMFEIRKKLDQLTVSRDGVDGKKVFMYGEGWHFGPLVRKLPNEAVTQYGAASMDIGLATFNDRFRDAIKGKGQNAHDLFVDDAFVTDKTGNRETILMGLLGSLKDVKGGYLNNPGESINYITAHDKATLWDTLVAKVGPYASTDQIVRIQQLSLSMLTLAQGVPFYHAGVEILRSKSGDENSYDSGDWFNKIDYSYKSNGWRGGLPPSWVGENLRAWTDWEYRLKYVSPPLEWHIKDTFEHFKDLQKIRRSSKLFRLATKEQVLEKISFPYRISNLNGQFDPRLIVMKLDDRNGRPVDSNIETIWVAFNSSWDQCISFSDEDLANSTLTIHPGLKRSNNRFTRDALRYHCGGERSNTTKWIPPQSTVIYYTTK